MHLVCSAAAFPHHFTALNDAKRKHLSERQARARHRPRHSPARRTLTASTSITSPRGSIPHQRWPTTDLLDSLLANRAVTNSHPIQEHERTISGGARSLMERHEPHKARQTASPNNKHEKSQSLLPHYLTETNCQPHPEARATAYTPTPLSNRHQMPAPTRSTKKRLAHQPNRLQMPTHQQARKNAWPQARARKRRHEANQATQMLLLAKNTIIKQFERTQRALRQRENLQAFDKPTFRDKEKRAGIRNSQRASKNLSIIYLPKIKESPRTPFLPESKSQQNDIRDHRRPTRRH